MQDKQDEQNLFEKVGISGPLAHRRPPYRTNRTNGIVQIREKYRQSGRMIQRWHEYIERTSNYDKLLQAKKNMGRQINQSKIRSKNARKTIQHKNRLELNTTTFQVSVVLQLKIFNNVLGSANNYREYTFGDNTNARSKILIFI